MPPPTSDRELRSITARVEPSADGRTLGGYAAVFDSPAEISEWGFRFTEVVKAGAFARTLAAGRDVLCAFNHNPLTHLLGRTASGTAKFWEDKGGLRFEVTLPDTAAGNEVRELVRRGDVAGASFTFRVAEGGEKWSSPTYRELTDLDLFEAGPVITPAYQETAVGLRDRRPRPATPNDLVRVRLALALKRR